MGGGARASARGAAPCANLSEVRARGTRMVVTGGVDRVVQVKRDLLKHHQVLGVRPGYYPWWGGHAAGYVAVRPVRFTAYI